MKQLDMYTVIQLFVLINGICTAVLLYLWARYGKRFNGIRDMALSFGITAAALMVYLLSENMPPLVRVAIPNILILVSICTFGIGVLSFSEVSVHKRALFVYITIFSIAIIVLTNDHLIINYVMMLLSGFAIPVYGYIAWAIRYRANTAYRSFTISVQWVSMAFVLLHAVRFGCASICPPIVDYNSTEGTAAATLITLSQVLTFVLAFAVEHMVVNKIAYEAFKETKTLAMQLEKKEALASTDSLTGLFNRRKIEALIREQHQILVNMGACYSILLIDVDHFKRVNDHYGHAVGDEVLMHLSHCIRDHIRGVDNVGRWGGEEFLVLLPNAALEEARKTAERLRGTVAAHVYSEMPELNLTISVGVIEANRMMTIDETLRSVDKMLYGAKANGRNSVFSGSVEVVASTSGGQ